MALTAPTYFGKYVLFRKIATGGMAELYLATNTELKHVERLIAIKRLLPHLADEETFVQSFIDEARLAAALRHQNIVQIYDCGTTEGSYYIEMEYLLGKDLTQVLNKAKLNAQPLSLAYALFIVAQICLGLDYAHKRKDAQGKPLNIIHRDVSPQNIVITYEGNVKMVDFGIAKAATQSTKTQVGMIKGKLAYMSPEQAEGQAIDHRSDIFSLGIILYELVTARRMFPDEDTLKLLTLVRRAEFEPPEQVNKDLPPPLYAILHKSLAKEPEQRYQFADEMLTDLEECMHHLPTWPTSRGLSQYMHQLFAEESEDQPLTHSLPPRVLDVKETPAKSKRPWLRYAAVAQAVLILGLGALLFLRDTPPIAPDMANLQAQLKQARWEVETGQQRRVQLEAQGGERRTVSSGTSGKPGSGSRRSLLSSRRHRQHAQRVSSGRRVIRRPRNSFSRSRQTSIGSRLRRRPRAPGSKPKSPNARPREARHRLGTSGSASNGKRGNKAKGSQRSSACRKPYSGSSKPRRARSVAWKHSQRDVVKRLQSISKQPWLLTARGKNH